MAYDAKAVANCFLDLANTKREKLSLMKLQKLIYFAHGWYLAITEKPLINERVEAWKYGPIIPSIYHEFKRFGNNPITSHATSLDLENCCLFEPHIPKEDSFVRSLIHKIWDVYGGLTATQLSNMTHLPKTPWMQIWGLNGVPKGTDIDDNLIKQYFISVAEKKIHA